MPDYNPKRRTALVLAGSGSTGAYHAGVLKALDESGVKIDLLVGSGVGTLAAAFGAVAGGSKLYGSGGFWEGVSRGSLYRVRRGLVLGAVLLLASLLVFLLPLLAALLVGLLLPLGLLVDVVAPGSLSPLLARLAGAPAALGSTYLVALAAPVILLLALSTVALTFLRIRDRRRIPEIFESFLDAGPARERLSSRLWEVSRGSALASSPPAPGEIGKRYASLLVENLGQPGFRELILRTADLDTGAPLSFALLASDAATTRRSFSVDLRSADELFFDVVMTGLLPLHAPVARVALPRGGGHGGQVHRLADATLAGGCGIDEALRAGAEQVIVAVAVPEAGSLPPRRRGPWALANGVVSTLERQAVQREIEDLERLNRIVETLGHRTEDGRKAWEDPASGRLHRSVALYLVRPERRSLGPYDLEPVPDPSTEVIEGPQDLLERGYRDAYRLFVEPVVGGEVRTAARVEATEAMEL